MATKITLDTIRAMTIHKRHELYKAAIREKGKGNTDADLILRLLDESELPYSDDTALKWDDGLALKIADIAFSKAGTEAMRNAIEDGLPPLAYLDPLVAQALGVDYGAHNHSTNIAGRLAIQRMEMLGYKQAGRKGPLPEGCVARSAEVMV